MGPPGARGRAHALRAEAIRRLPRQLPQVRHHLAQGARLRNHQPDHLPAVRRRPPAPPSRPARLRQVLRVHLRHLRRGRRRRRGRVRRPPVAARGCSPGDVFAALPSPRAVARHSHPLLPPAGAHHVGGGGRRRLRLPDRVRLPGPQGRVRLHVAVHHEQHGEGCHNDLGRTPPGGGGAIDRAGVRPVLRRAEHRWAAVAPRPRVLGGEPEAAGEGPLPPVRGDAARAGAQRGEARRVPAVPVHRRRGGGRGGGRQRRPMQHRPTQERAGEQDRGDRPGGEEGELLPERGGRRLEQPHVAGDGVAAGQGRRGRAARLRVHLCRRCRRL